MDEINKNNRANATRGPSPVQKMFRDRTEATLDRRGPGPGPGPVLTLQWILQCLRGRGRPGKRDTEKEKWTSGFRSEEAAAKTGSDRVYKKQQLTY